jgi:hypothetical protein
MDEHARLDWDGGRWRPVTDARRMGHAGEVMAWSAA